jgi:hypothetical protein
MAWDDEISTRGEVLVTIAKAYDEAKTKQAKAILLDAAGLILHYLQPELPAKKPELLPFKMPDKPGQ